GNGGAIADTVHFEAARKAVGDSGNHVGDEASSEPMQRPLGRLIRRAFHAQTPVLADEVDLPRHLARKLSARAFDAHRLVAEVEGHGIGDGDRHLANSGHGGMRSPLPDVRRDFAAYLESTRPGTTPDAL